MTEGVLAASLPFLRIKNIVALGHEYFLWDTP